MLMRCMACLLVLWAVPAWAAQPSERSLKQLLEVTQARELLDNLSGQMDQVMEHAMQEVLRSGKLDDDAREVAEQLRLRMVAIMQDQLQWEWMEALQMRIYRQHFSQEEVDAMIAFYGSEVGQSVIGKMPLVLQESMLAVQERLPGMMAEFRQAQEDAKAELRSRRAASDQ